MTREEYENIKRIIAVLSAALCWVISIYFSVQGFDLKAINSTWLALGMGLLVTFVELVGNQKGVKKSLLMVVVVFVVYIYGVTTNLVGILGMQGMNDTLGVLTGDAMRFFLVMVVAVILEVIPEVMVIYGITGEFEADFFTNMISADNRHGHNKQGGGQPNQNQQQKDNQQPRHDHDQRPQHDQRHGGQHGQNMQRQHSDSRDVPGFLARRK